MRLKYRKSCRPACSRLLFGPNITPAVNRTGAVLPPSGFHSFRIVSPAKHKWIQSWTHKLHNKKKDRVLPVVLLCQTNPNIWNILQCIIITKEQESWTVEASIVGKWCDVRMMPKRYQSNSFIAGFLNTKQDVYSKSNSTIVLGFKYFCQNILNSSCA